jgi:hypothetical protein
MATTVAVDTRTRHLFHCHRLLLHMEYRVICLCAVFRATSWQHNVIRPVVRMSRSPACGLTQAFFAYSQRGGIHCAQVCRLSTKFGTVDTGICRQNRLTCGRVEGRQAPAYELMKWQHDKQLVTVCAAAPRPHTGEMWDSLSMRHNV